MNAPECLVHSMDADLAEKHVVTACSDSIVRIYSLVDKKLEYLAELVGHSGPVTKALYVNQGELIASSDFSGKIVIWKLEGGVFNKRFEKQLLEGPIYDMAVRFADGRLQLFCGCDGGVLKTLEISASFECTEDSKEVHRYGISAVSANAECLVTGGFDFSVALHTASGVEHFKHHQAAVTSVAIAPVNCCNKTVFSSCSEDGKLFIIEQRGDSFETQEIDVGEPCYSLSWSNTGFVLTVGYGTESFKSFILGESGKYEEIEMKQASE